MRYSSSALSTDYTYTGQYSNTADFGLMFYNARWYDPALGRFAQADTVVPGAMAIDFDRYAYVRNSPTGAVDPSGHFEEEALNKWFGDGWQKKFDPVFYNYLKQGQFGDIVQIGDDRYMFVSGEDGRLFLWRIGGDHTGKPGHFVPFEDIYGIATPQNSALYRPENASYGPSGAQWGGVDLGPFEGISHNTGYNATYYKVDSNDCGFCPATYQLPPNWHVGERGSIRTREAIVGINVTPVGAFLTGAGTYETIKGMIGQSVAKRSLGGLSIIVGILDLCVYDTFYEYQAGSHPFSPQPVPTPSMK